jgi:nicotinamidase-related amidase
MADFTPTDGTSIEAEPYKWPHDASFSPSTSALVVIDMQVDFCSPGGYLDCQGIPIEPTRAVIPKIQSLLTAFRRAGFPVYHTREGHRPDLSTLSSRELLRSRNNPIGMGIGDHGPLGRLLVRGEKGHEIIPELAPLASEPVIDKPGRSAFQHTDFKLLLDNRSIKNLVICGVTTDVCVTSTMRDASTYK